MIRIVLIFRLLLIFAVVGCTAHNQTDGGRVSLIEGLISLELPADMVRVPSPKYAQLGKLADDGRPIVFVEKARDLGLIVSYADTRGSKVGAFHLSLLVRSMATKRPEMRVLDTGKRLISGAHAGYAVYEAPGIKGNSAVTVHHMTFIDLPDGLFKMILQCPVAYKDVCKRHAAQISESLIIPNR